MANYTLIARINAGNGKFPFVSVRYSKNHRPIPIEGATYYLRPTSRGKRTPIRIGKDVAVAHTEMINMDYGRPLERPVVPEVHPQSVVAGTVSRKTVEEAALEYIQRSRQKSRKTYLGHVINWTFICLCVLVLFCALVVAGRQGRKNLQTVYG